MKKKINLIIGLGIFASVVIVVVRFGLHTEAAIPGHYDEETLLGI